MTAPVFLGGLEGCEHLGGGMLAEGGDDAGGVEPARVEYLLPVDVAGLDLAERGVAAVVELIAGPGTDADLDEREPVAGAADLVIGLDHDVGHVHAVHLGAGDDVPARPVVHQLGDVCRFHRGQQLLHAEVGDVDAAVELRRRYAELELVALTQAVMLRRGHADVGLAEAHEIIFCHL